MLNIAINNPDTHTATEIPLNQLEQWDGNIRKIKDAGLNELVASIENHGLLQSLVVRQKEDGSGYYVIAGGRRLKALTALNKNGRLPDNWPVPCRLIPAGSNEQEISLAENIVRENMHPVEQFQAFTKLAENHTPLVDIAAHFGVSETTVAKYLKLGNLSPKVIDAWRVDEITMAMAQAFAATDNHELQNQVLDDMKEHPHHYEDVDDLRHALISEKVTAADPRVQIIGLQTYRDAGGKEERDLFTDNDAGIFLTDSALLEKLFNDHIEKERVRLKAEGWFWVDYTKNSKWDYIRKNNLTEENRERRDPTEADQQEIDRLQKQIEAIEVKVNEENRDYTDEESQLLDTIEDKIDELENRELFWSDDVKSRAGVLAYIGYNGKLEFVEGLVRPEQTIKKIKKKEEQEEIKQVVESEDSNISDAMASAVTITKPHEKELCGYKTVSLAAALYDNENAALAATTHAMAYPLFYTGKVPTCLNIHMDFPIKEMDGKIYAGTKAYDTLMIREWQSWKDAAPENNNEFLPWCMEQDKDTLIRLISFAAACSIETQANSHENNSDNRLASIIDLNMADWFETTAHNYFNRIGKMGILMAIKEGTGAAITPEQNSMKKETLAAEAERLLTGKNWLPPIFRFKKKQENKEA